MRKKEAPAKPNRLRIIGGVWRGRLIEAPSDNSIRPTTDRVRESLFNRLMHGAAGSGIALAGARVADVFAGTGAMGLEALSRGAAHVTFIERDMAAMALIKRNVAALGAEDRVSVMSADATNLPKAALAHDIALLDAPYEQGLPGPAMASLARQGWLKPGALVSVEMDESDVPPDADGFTLLDRREAGRIAVILYQWTANDKNYL
ncbi:MAG: 16S rRNA (guanine(966)-N(2))-methyltransferase RsmD [Proteobacteria bacterium]|nr:16S rRNA (guanine(966)-N(2))-methyltransferase RsmD [Pseudomonadota bacterium]